MSSAGSDRARHRLGLRRIEPGDLVVEGVGLLGSDCLALGIGASLDVDPDLDALPLVAVRHLAPVVAVLVHARRDSGR